jgi:hypothetical protein
VTKKFQLPQWMMTKKNWLPNCMTIIFWSPFDLFSISAQGRFGHYPKKFSLPIKSGLISSIDGKKKVVP